MEESFRSLVHYFDSFSNIFVVEKSFCSSVSFHSDVVLVASSSLEEKNGAQMQKDK